jgi:hypothetical protein
MGCVVASEFNGSMTWSPCNDHLSETATYDFGMV